MDRKIKIIFILVVVICIGSIYWKHSKEEEMTASKEYDFIWECDGDKARVEGLMDGNCFKKVVLPSEIALASSFSIETGKMQVISISEEAFYNLDKIESITIPITITEIGKNAFYGCKNIKNVSYLGTQEQWNKVKIERGNECLLNADFGFKM